MSNNNFTCRDKYYNYGSYLRSRGYDKEICNLVTDIENGSIKIGPITPGNCASNKPTVIEGNVTIKKCITDPSSGILTVNGGIVGTDTGSLIDATYFGLQVLKGAKISGPIYQTVDCSHSNYFSAGNHVFQGGNWGMDCSANVVINGDLIVTGDVSLTSLTVYDLSVLHVLTVGTSTSYIDTSNVNTANMIVTNKLDVSGVDISNNLLIGGNITGTNGDLIISSGVTGDLYLTAGTPVLYDKDIKFNAIDFDFSGSNVNFIDISDNVTFNKNPLINNGSNYSNRLYNNYGQSTTIIDICNNTGSGTTWALGTHDLSLNSIIYSDFSGASLMYNINDNIIDFSNNQDLAKDTLYEVSVYSRVKFNNNVEALSYEFKEIGAPSNKVYIDTRSIQKNKDYSVCFGPSFFVFQTGVPDNNYLTKQFIFAMDISGISGSVDLIDPPRLTIKQKSLV
jgi:hypothetical protein